MNFDFFRMSNIILNIALVLIYCSYISCTSSNSNGFSFASFYQDHMVLQREPYKANVWGYAVNGSTVSLEFNGKQYQSLATKVYWTNSSIWKIVIDAQPASISSVNLTFTQTTSTGQQSTIQLSDVLFGDVWICSGIVWLCLIFKL